MAASSSLAANLCEASSQALIEARRVLHIEGNALLALCHSLDETFEKAVSLLAQTKGKVILSGLGKSGHISRKIASTLSSTGTPSFFLHPSEASHGDLGMISKNDTLILVSNSGETAELAHVITYSRRHKIPMIAITARPESSLAQVADIILALPQLPEACPLGLAPTTSTTLTLALGDALAMVLLKRKKFQEGDYGNLHPGGSLGRKLLKVEQLMRKGSQVPCVKIGTPMSDAILEISAKGFGCVGVVTDALHLKGIITDGDLRRHMSPGLLSASVEAVMTPSPLTIFPDHLAVEALALMNEKSVMALFVVDLKAVVQGLVRMHDCLKGEVL